MVLQLQNILKEELAAAAKGGIMDWQIIFQLSKVNGGPYLGDMLPYQNWMWPKNTWLQQKRRDIRAGEKTENPWPVGTLEAINSN